MKTKLYSADVLKIIKIDITFHTWLVGGAREDRTPDLLRARQALSQLSYGPWTPG